MQSGGDGFVLWNGVASHAFGPRGRDQGSSSIWGRGSFHWNRHIDSSLVSQKSGDPQKPPKTDGVGMVDHSRAV